MSRPRLRLLGASLVTGAVATLTAGTGVPGGLPAASAATCTGTGGVSVVVDFRELGGGVQTACDPQGGGRSAATIFTGTGFALSYVQRQPGFVCRVDGVPASDPCVNTPPSNAYWGLYWSDGSAARWSYSTLGAQSLTVPEGGSVAFAWQGASTGGPATAPPLTSGASSSPSPSQTASPSPTPTTQPSGSGDGTTSPSSGPAPGGSAGTSPTRQPSPSAPSGSDPGGAGSAPPGSAPSPSGPGTGTPGTRTGQARSAAPPAAPGANRQGGRSASPASTPSSGPGDDTGTMSATPTASPAATTATGDAPVDGPARLPAAVTYGVLGLLAVAVGVSAVLARRRRGA